MLINHTTFSLRLKLDDIFKGDEQVILENIRHCKKFVGKQFKVIFRNENVSQKDCETFVKRNEKMLFEIHTQITTVNSPFDSCWFLINSDDKDKCKSRYRYDGDILRGISEYLKMIKFFNKGKNLK